MKLALSSTSSINFTAPHHTYFNPILSQCSIYTCILHDVSKLKFYTHFLSLQIRTIFLVHEPILHVTILNIFFFKVRIMNTNHLVDLRHFIQLPVAFIITVKYFLRLPVFKYNQSVLHP